MKITTTTAFLFALLLVCSCSDRTPPTKPSFFKLDPGRLSRFTSSNTKKLVESQWDSIIVGFYLQDEDGTYRRYYWKCADMEKLAALRSKFSSSIKDVVLVGSRRRCYSHEMTVTISDSSRWALCFSAANAPKDRYLSVFKYPPDDSRAKGKTIPTKVMLDYKLGDSGFYEMLTDLIVKDFARSINLTLNVDLLVYNDGQNAEALSLEGRGPTRKVKRDYHWFSRMDDSRLVVSD